jgi:hypothetical protein
MYLVASYSVHGRALREIQRSRSGSKMRTFPRELATFRTMVKDRGARLRALPFAELQQLGRPTEHVEINGRKADIGVIVISLSTGGLQIVLQGFMEHRFMPGKSVTLDGFFKYPDETVAEMRPDEFWDFD